jgi:succinate dehydrogenase / fumarate reductase cytochrome b subunit
MAPWIAGTGLALVLFLVLHLGGVGLALIAPQPFERYAAHLHTRPWLPLLELTLAATALIHLATALARAAGGRLARGPMAGSRRSRRAQAGFWEALAAHASRLAPWSGALLLAFLAVHLAQLRWPRPAPGHELTALLAVLDAPGWLALYLLAGVAVALHLLHGHESAHRSLGFLDAANAAPIRRLGRGLALLVGGGFALLPVLLVLRHRPPGVGP